MNGKLKIVVPVILLAVLGGGYKFALAKPKAEPEPKVHGNVYVLGKEFLVNLHEGRFAKVTVALVLDHADPTTAPAGGHGGHGAAPAPPEGYGPMTQEALVRAIVTDELTDAKDTLLIEREGREKLQHHILERIEKSTDVQAHEVLFTDVTVQ